MEKQVDIVDNDKALGKPVFLNRLTKVMGIGQTRPWLIEQSLQTSPHGLSNGLTRWAIDGKTFTIVQARPSEQFEPKKTSKLLNVSVCMVKANIVCEGTCYRPYKSMLGCRQSIRLCRWNG